MTLAGVNFSAARDGRGNGDIIAGRLHIHLQITFSLAQRATTLTLPHSFALPVMLKAGCSQLVADWAMNGA